MATATFLASLPEDYSDYIQMQLIDAHLNVFKTDVARQKIVAYINGVKELKHVGMAAKKTRSATPGIKVYNFESRSQLSKTA